MKSGCFNVLGQIKLLIKFGYVKKEVELCITILYGYIFFY